MFKPVVVIPSKLNSARCPGKALKDIEGAPMIQRVWERAVMSGLGPVAVATPDEEIRDALLPLGANVVMVPEPYSLKKGSDAVYYAAKSLGWLEWTNCVVNLQGDLPFITTKLLKKVVEPVHWRAPYDILTIAAPMYAAAKTNPNVVKIVTTYDEDADLLRCHRFVREHEKAVTHTHTGVYAFTPLALDKFANTPISESEQELSLEQLRAMDHGMKIAAVTSSVAIHGFDNNDDFKYFEDKK